MGDDSNDVGHQGSSKGSSHNNNPSEAQAARARADALMEELARYKAASKRAQSGGAEVENSHQFEMSDGQIMNHNNFSNEVNKHGPNFGAFGEIRNKSSLLQVNDLADSVCHGHDSVCSGRPRLLKSGLNRSYNDLVVRELIWPNDLVLRLLELHRATSPMPKGQTMVVPPTIINGRLTKLVLFTIRSVVSGRWITQTKIIAMLFGCTFVLGVWMRGRIRQDIPKEIVLFVTSIPQKTQKAHPGGSKEYVVGCT